jgi:hypothetical protein
MDISYISAALAGINHVLTIGKTITDQKVATEINSALVDITSKLIQAQQQTMEVQAENYKLIEEIKDLKAKEDFQSRVTLHDGAYWKRREDGTEEGPFCPSCWGLDKKLVLPFWHQRDGEGYVDLMCSHHGKVRRKTCSSSSSPVPPLRQSSQ